MRFAYIDSNGNEVPIPSVDALALRIELGAITESTQLYDAQADQWGPAHTHEIFHSLSRDVGGEEGFVAPPPVAPPPVQSPPSDAAREETEGAGAREGEPGAASGPAEAPADESVDEDDTSFGLTLAEPEPAPEERAAKRGGGGARRADELPVQPESRRKREAGPPDDDLPYLDLEPDAEPEKASTDLSGSAPETEEQGSRFDFGGMDGDLELEDTLEGPDAMAMDPAADVGRSGTDAGDGMELERVMEFDAGAFEGGDDESLDLETPMSRFSPGEPPAWMEEEEPSSADTVLDFSSVGASVEAEGDADVPLRARRTPRNKPSPPKLPRQYNLAVPIIGIVVLLAVGIGGYVAWPIVRDRLAGSGDEGPAEVRIPPLSEELMPRMRQASEDALGAVFERERSEWAASSRVQEPPSQWLAGVYLANAGDFAEVEAFWSGMSDFLDRVRDIDLTTFDAALQTELEARSLSATDSEAIRARADSGFVAAAPRRAEVVESFERLIEAALQLHRFLVANESAIEYAPATAVTTDPVLEVSPATDAIREAMEELLDSVIQAQGALDYRDRVTAEGLRSLLRTRFQEAAVQ